MNFPLNDSEKSKLATTALKAPVARFYAEQSFYLPNPRTALIGRSDTFGCPVEHAW